MEMKNVKELLMSAITNFVIAEKAGEYCKSEQYMGKVHDYLVCSVNIPEWIHHGTVFGLRLYGHRRG